MTVFYIKGVVTDGVGRLMTGATVSDGGQTVTVAADGSYALPEDSTGAYVLTAERYDTGSVTVQATANLPVDYVQDFTLPYKLFGTVSRFDLSTAAGPAQTVLTVTTYAPEPGSLGDGGGRSCLWVTDSRTAATSPMRYVSTDPSNLSTWSYTVTLPRGTPENVYSLSPMAEDCSTGATLTTSVSFQYVVDNTAPSISSPSPAGWTNLGSPAVQVGVTDSGGRGIYPQGSTMSVDGTVLPHPYALIDQTYRYGYEVGTLRAQASGLGEGRHIVQVVVQDLAGNQSSLSFAFSVDLTSPTLGDPAPTGEVETRSPLLSVRAGDVASGVDPAGITMTLSNGVLASPARPTFDQSTGLIAYQVPDEPRGTGIGQFPLVDGTYTVSVSVRDVAGNTVSLRWSFTVKILAKGLPGLGG